MNRRRLVAALALSALLAGCTKVGGEAGSVSPSGERNSFTTPHTLRYTTASELNNLNPLLLQDLTLGLLSSLTMAWLVRYDAHNLPIPELATEVPTQQNRLISADGKTITFHLRKGVVWSDGAPFDARDVVFTYKQVMNPANNITSRTGWDLITRLDTPDSYTVVFHLKQPYASFLPTFFGTAAANPCILPEHILRGVPNINNVPYNSLPVGIGPFKYVSWQRGQQIELAANDKYWRGKPKLERIIFKIIPDRNTVLTQMQTHEVDLWYPIGGAYYDRVRSIQGISTIRQPSYLFNHFDFNMTRPIFKEEAVREALRYAIDRKLIIDKIGHGIGILQESPIGPTHPMFKPGIPTVPFDLAKANALLDGAGWKRGPDGIRAKNGMRLSIFFAAFTGSPDVDSQLALIQGWWKQIGVELNVHRYAAPIMFAPYAEGGIIYAGKFDMVGFAWQDDPVGDVTNLYDSSQIPPNGQNDPRYRNAQVDAALAAFRRTYDPAKQKTLAGFVQAQVVKDVPTIVNSFREDIYGFNADLKDFHPNAVTPFDDFMNVDI
ncbi:MAG: peptide ABC transporter substrate-binding protein [Candidatus Eremiobacteraeota bacterium]|nr:peptide ABC transporter substrate-binding protein [Candidatus Eremiobacteraeota bacterium]